MADDITIPATGSGTATPVVATDDVSGVHYQKMKLDLGGDGASVPVSGSVPTSGDKAHDDVDSGNPVKIGGKANLTPPVGAADGDRVDAWFGREGQLAVTLVSGDASGTAMGPVYSDSSAAPGVVVQAQAWQSIYNGSSWDRMRGAPSSDAGARTGIAAAGLMGYNGSTWDRVRVANTGRLQVDVVTGGGGGTQYVGDAPATATPAGTVAMGLANAAAPTDVSANNDAVSLWALRNGSQVVNLASGGTLITQGQKAMAASLPVVVASDQSAIPVSGTFWQATQPVSAASLPLPTGAATSALQGGGLPSALASDRLKVDGSGVTQPVSGTFWQATQPVSGTVTANAGTGTMAVSAASLPLPSGAATSALQGGGLPSALASDRLKVDGSGVTQPVSMATNQPYVAPTSIVSVSATYSTTQTSANLVAGTGGQRIYVTQVTISTAGTTAGLVTLYWGTGAFSRGTSPTLSEAHFIPSATSAPGAVLNFPIPVGGQSATGDNLRITTSAAINPLYVTVHYFKA